MNTVGFEGGGVAYQGEQMVYRKQEWTPEESWQGNKDLNCTTTRINLNKYASLGFPEIASHLDFSLLEL